jgi:hypothetical protein
VRETYTRKEKRPGASTSKGGMAIWLSLGSRHAPAEKYVKTAMGKSEMLFGKFPPQDF